MDGASLELLPNYYAVLNVGYHADVKVIHEAFVALSRNLEAFYDHKQMICDAYLCLSNPVDRDAYNAFYFHTPCWYSNRLWLSYRDERRQLAVQNMLLQDQGAYRNEVFASGQTATLEERLEDKKAQLLEEITKVKVARELANAMQQRVEGLCTGNKPWSQGSSHVTNTDKADIPATNTASVGASDDTAAVKPGTDMNTVNKATDATTFAGTYKTASTSTGNGLAGEESRKQPIKMLSDSRWASPQTCDTLPGGAPGNWNKRPGRAVCNECRSMKSPHYHHQQGSTTLCKACYFTKILER